MRLFLDAWQHSSDPPTLEKVKAHDEQGRSAGNQKSWGNEKVDGLAKIAADGVDDEYSPNPRHMDAVQVHDAAGRWLKDVSAAVTRGWWEQHRTAGATRRSWLMHLYPAGWILIGAFLIIFFAYPAWKEASLFMPHLGGY